MHPMHPSHKGHTQVMLLLTQSLCKACIQSRQVFCWQNSKLYKVKYISQLSFLTWWVLGLKYNLMQFKYQSSLKIMYRRLLQTNGLGKFVFSTRQEMLKEKPLMDHVVQILSPLFSYSKIAVNSSYHRP